MVVSTCARINTTIHAQDEVGQDDKGALIALITCIVRLTIVLLFQNCQLRYVYN